MMDKESTFMKRREFVRSVLGTGGGLLILPSGTLFGQNAPSNKLNIALVGVWGRGVAHYRILKTQNVVALCDTNEDRLAQGLEIFPSSLW
jgi:hypothetical protein